MGIAGIGYAYIELYFLLSVERRIYGIISSPSSILFVGYFVAFFIPWIVGSILLLVDICMQISNASTVANDNSTSNQYYC